MERIGPYYYVAVGAMIASALFFPFWTTLLIFLVGAIFMPQFYPGLVILFIMDVLYAPGVPRVGPFFGMLTMSGIMAYIIIAYIKSATTIYHH